MITKADLKLRNKRTAAPNWYVLDYSNGRRVIDGVDLGEATAFVQRYTREEGHLAVQRSALWIEPTKPPRQAA